MKTLVTGTKENGSTFEIETSSNYLPGVIMALLEFGVPFITIENYLPKEEKKNGSKSSS
ncbi:MAG: hypothetical protein NC310_00400 [Roseburia sp.]|nr:hypothetical protein [Anaeroplasma bactoclasticum]MCM1195512.1 hypothetical protein [Roseburia sp.]MCM1556891.1 hypothetical protein [Anaeroplasma bactoclasticum]